MKKAILFFVSVLFICNGFSQNAGITKVVNSNIQVVIVDSARTFSINYPNGEEFRKKLMLAWGRPDEFSAGSMVWSNLSLQDVGNNMKIVITDGIETAEESGVVYKIFSDDNSKYSMINDLKSNQKRIITIVFENQEGSNIIAGKNTERSVISAIDHIITSVW